MPIPKETIIEIDGKFYVVDGGVLRQIDIQRTE